MTIYELFVYIINLPWWTIPLGFFGFFGFLILCVATIQNERGY